MLYGVNRIDGYENVYTLRARKEKPTQPVLRALLPLAYGIHFARGPQTRQCCRKTDDNHLCRLQADDRLLPAFRADQFDGNRDDQDRRDRQSAHFFNRIFIMQVSGAETSVCSARVGAVMCRPGECFASVTCSFEALSRGANCRSVYASSRCAMVPQKRRISSNCHVRASSPSPA